MSSCVLDASAILALANGEPGGEVVQRAVEDGAAIGTVNLSEVAARLLQSGMGEVDIRKYMGLLKLDTQSFSPDLAYTTATLKRPTRHRSLSLGDRACLALAQELGLPALTADRNWDGLSVGVEIRLIR